MRISLFFIAIIFALGVTVQTAMAENAKFHLKKINLGIIVPLSGPLAFFGQDFVRAAKLAREKYPEIGKSINFLWEDSAYDSKQAISAFNKLASIDKVDIVLSFGGPMLAALAPLAEAKKMPFFATESEKSDCEKRYYCSLFRNEEDEWGKATWQALRKQGHKSVGIVKNQNQFMNTFVNALVRNKSEEEKVAVLLDIPPDVSDLRSSILLLKSKKVDALGVYLLPGTHHGFLTAFRNLNRSFPLFGVEEFLVKENNKGFENLIEGALVVAPGSTENYRTEFESKYGYSAGFFYTPAFYDFIALLNDTIVDSPDLRGIELVKALHFEGYRSGVSGRYSVKQSEKGVYSYSFPIFVYKVSNGAFSVEEKISF